MSLQVWLPLDGTLSNKGLSNATVVNYGATVNTNGKVGSCYSFNGTSNYLSIPFTDFGNNFSVSLWFNRSSSNSVWILCSRVVAYGGLGLYVDASTSKLTIDCMSNAVSSSRWVTPTVISNNTWYHVTIIRNQQKIMYYLNGEFVAEKQIAYSNTVGPVLTVCVRNTNGSSLADYSSYKINDLRIYDHCLSPKEIKEISQGLILHYPLNDISEGYERLDYITLTGTQYFFIDKPTGQKSSMQVEMGIQPDTLSHSQPTFFSGRNSGVQFYRSSTSSLTLWTSSGSASIGTFVAGKINSLIVNMTSSSVRTDLNGSVKTSTNTNAFNKLFSDACDKFTVGAYSTGSYPFFGNMSYLNLYVDGELIFLGVPYKRKTDNVAGMYDLVTDQFFTSDGSQNFVAGNAMPGLSNRIFDCSGFGNNGTIKGTLSIDSDSPRYNYSTSFNGSSAINAGRGSMVKDELSVSMWAYMDNWSNFSDKRLASCTQVGGWNFEPSNGKLAFVMGTGVSSNTYKSAISTTSLTNLSSGWHYFVGTYDGFSTKIYIDGVIDGFINAYTTKTPIFYNATNTIFIGAEAGTDATTPVGNYFVGKISDFRIYATALSDADILDLYNAPIYIDNQGNVGAFEFIENSSNGQSLEKTGIVEVKNFIEASDNLKLMQDGSVFLKLLRHKNPSSNLFTKNNCWLTSSNANLQSSLILLKNIDWINNLSEYEFLAYEKLTSSSTEIQVRWSQTSNPALTSSATGFQLISGSAQYLTNGLANAGTHGCFDINGNNWWCCCGCYDAYRGGIPGFSGVITSGYVELYIRIPNEIIKGYIDTSAKFFNQSIVSGNFKEI